MKQPKFHIGALRKRFFNRDTRAVTEALGTVFLLAISITLVGLVFVWVNSLADFDEGRALADLSISYQDDVVSIEHKGGEVLQDAETEILIQVDTYLTRYSISESEGDMAGDLDWGLGETWNKTVLSTPDSEIYVAVYDLNTNTRLIGETVQAGAGRARLADLSVLAENITFEFSGANIRKDDLVNITVRVTNEGSANAYYVLVRFYDGANIIRKNNREYQLVNVTAGGYNTTWIHWYPDSYGLHTIHVKVFYEFGEINYANNYAEKNANVEVILPEVHGSDMKITTYDILFDNSNPTHGALIKVTILVHNEGDRAVTAKDGATLIVRDTPITWNPIDPLADKPVYTDGVHLNKTFYNVTIPVSGYTPYSFWWSAMPGGTVLIYAFVDANNTVMETEDTNGLYESNNLAIRAIQILPKIVLVDDDGASAGSFDVTSTMRDSLTASGVVYDNHYVIGSDDPAYDTGSHPLKDYDIIIWMTGYNTNTLTPANIEAIKSAMKNGTYLWMISQDVLNDTVATQGDPVAGEFAYDFLGVDEYTMTGTPVELYGVPGDVITNGTLLNTTGILRGQDRGVNISAFKSDTLKEDVNGILYNTVALGQDGNMSVRYYNATHDFKVVYFGWEFASLVDPTDRADLTFKVLQWFNWTILLGTDFAIASEKFSTLTPRYLDRLEINATVRNNGADTATVDVAFFLTGPDGEEELIPKFPDNQANPYSITIPGNGGEVTVGKQWLAVSVGLHNFRVMVDPYDLVDEVSEANNDISYSNLAVTQLLIQYTILVVDDDNSTNNGGFHPNATAAVTTALDNIDYPFDFRSVTGGLSPGNGPTVDVMKHYNTVIWITGNDTGPTLNGSDQQNIVEYIRGLYFEAQYLTDIKVNLWLIGQHILEDLTVTNATFISEILRVSSFTSDTGMPSTLYGVYDDIITHGIQYDTNTLYSDYGDTITPGENATGILYQSRLAGTYNSLRFNDTEHRLIFMPWIYDFISTPAGFPSDETYQSELAFLIMQWFAYPELRIELKTSVIDITVSNDNPMIGDSYIIRTALYNYGGNDTSTVVRFLDGSTIIDTQAVYVPAGGSSATEVIWTPLFAGKRNLKVAVDPQNDVDEIFERLNNNATRVGFNVFYFFDDLENGTGNWQHDGTIIHITGESPLDYMDKPVYSNIMYDWNRSESGGFIPTSYSYHSFNYSYYTYEPEGTVSIVFTLDNSETMTAQNLYDLKVAFNSTINNMSDDDRVAMLTYNTTTNHTLFDGNGSYTLLTDLATNEDDDGFLELGGNYTCPIHGTDESGRAVAKHLVSILDNSGGVGRPLWETVNAAIDLAYSYGRGVPAVFAMTSGNDSGPPNGSPPDEGPAGPWDPLDPKTFNGNDGNITDDWTIGKVYDVCNAPVKVYTVGLNLPGGKTGISIGNPLNETSESSNATFYHTTDSATLSDIYNEMFIDIFRVTQARSARAPTTFFEDDFETDLTKWPTRSTKWSQSADRGYGTSTYSAKLDAKSGADSTLESISIDLSSATSATLTFYHWLIGTEDADIVLEFYNGVDWDPIDDFGTEVTVPNSWVKKTVTINVGTYGIPSFQIRFNGNTNPSEYVYIDDVLLSGEVSTGPGSTPGTTERSLWGAGDRNLTTESFDLLGVTTATLTWYQKYDIKSAMNGLVVQIGIYNSTDTTWRYRYLYPKQPYTSNYDTRNTRRDDFGTDMRWCYNGVSGYGLYTWDFIEVDLSNYTGQTNLRVRYLYMWSGWGDGGYYFIDDVKLRVIRNDTTAVTSAAADQWAMTTGDAHSGTHSWWICDPSTGHLSGGLDNSLYTRPIDLTGARNATLSAYFKFNINASAGRPPDGFRVEISSDNGVSWKALNLGVRTAWGVSGNESDAEDGTPGDGKSYTGLDSGNRWVHTSTLARLNTDISGWAGNVVMLRFRVVTASDDNPDFSNHYEWAGAGFGGIYVDDIIISGFSLLG
ncbi:MAG: type IV pilin [Thermoplasmata archaeon]|nr:MAG: type IV pilin [Thermoplasmata archaeon]